MQASKPVMGIVQDALVAARMFTARDTFLDKAEMMNLLMHLPSFDGVIPQPAVMKPTPLWTGKQLFGLLLPDVGLGRRSAWHVEEVGDVLDRHDSTVVIRRGHLLSGALCKKTLGTSSGGLVHVICLEHGAERAAEFLSHTQYMMNHWLQNRGFSVGIGDMVIDDGCHAEIAETLGKAKKTVGDLVRQLHRGEIEVIPGQTQRDTFEGKVNQMLNGARDEAGKAVRLSRDNNVSLMAQAGSKGSSINISQMTACVGQQNVEGKRVGFGFQDRTMPHYRKWDVGPEACGFVSSSYIQGLTPSEAFHHAIGGREGLVDTAVKTSTTGYIQRRLVKAMEDVMVCYDGTVRTSGGMITQFLYGEDGLSGAAVAHHGTGRLPSSQDEFDRMFRHADLRAQELMQEETQLRSDVAELTQIQREGRQLLLPANLPELVQDARRRFGGAIIGKPCVLSLSCTCLPVDLCGPCLWALRAWICAWASRRKRP